MNKIRFSFKKYTTSLFYCCKVLMLGLLTFSVSSLPSQNSDIFISSFAKNAIGRYDGETGAFKGDFVASGSGGLVRPQKVFFHPITGHLLVTGFLNAQIKMYDKDTGAFLGNFSSGYNLSSPAKMILGDDNLIYVTQWGRKVARFNLDGTFVDEFTSISIPAAVGMTWDEENNLYVASWGTNGRDGQVYKFDAQGNSQGIFIDSERLEGPVGIWRDDAGDFLVVDWRLGSVLRFDSNGNYKNTFISGNQRTEGHAFGTDGSIYLCDVQANRVGRYNPDGTFIEFFINESSLSGPNDIEFRPTSLVSSTEETDLAKQINLQVSPNPFRGHTSIQFQLTASNYVKLRVFNNMGQEIANLQEANLGSGDHQVKWDAENLPEDVYFLQLAIGDKMLTKKIILSK